ncbi:hypothetical protein INT43_003859 [Umbelopsis isabellina]|uniref:Uncharacterized protein n=1 Tax=Mortierella isabellina TaxID=91625 RepID=A0A8H7PTI8_MORIS|nr:hypothetical protein INT43_003859 [Umbelopsis isabellina]
MVHPAIVAAIIGAAVVAGVVTYYYIDDHYHNEYEYVQTTRYEHYSDSDSDDEEQGFNARRLLQKAGLRRRRRYRDNNTPNESFNMAARDEKSSMSSASDIDMKRQLLESERQDLRLDEEEARLRRERLRSRGNSILGIMPTTMEDQMAQAPNPTHDNPFADSHEVPKVEKSELFEADNSNLANKANSAPLSETSSHHNTLLDNDEDTPYGSILSSILGNSAHSPLMRPVSPRQDPATEAWRYDDHEFIEANEQDDAMEYESVETSLQLPRARGHSNATVSSSSSWSDIEPSSSQNKSDLSDSDLSIIGRERSSHDGRSASEDEDGFVNVGGDDHNSS